MSNVSFGVQFDSLQFEQFDKLLGGLEMLERMPAIKSGMNAVCDVVVNQLKATLPKPGYPGDKKGKTPLRETVRKKVVEYPNGKVVALVGYDYKSGGQHGHLVEKGHRMVVRGPAPAGFRRKVVGKQKHRGEEVGFVAGRYYLQKASEATASQQQDALEGAVKQALKDLEG